MMVDDGRYYEVTVDMVDMMVDGRTARLPVITAVVDGRYGRYG